MAARIASYFLKAIALATALGCASQPQAPAPSRPPPRVVSSASTSASSSAPTRPRLRVGTSGDYAPFSQRDASGAVHGFDAEIAAELARDLGLELEWVSFRWPTLQSQLENGDFDVAMGGVTWQPARGVLGYLTRAVARGGPCVLGDEQAKRVAVNHGGVLEGWARGHFADREVVVVEANETLPDLLASGRAGAIVTDTFERKAFQRPGWTVRCEPALARKVYWLAPHRAELASRVDDWLRAHSGRLEGAQQRWFGERQPLNALSNLSDLLARRMAFMPLVAAAKAKLNLPIEDLPREKLVLDSTSTKAHALGLPEAGARDFFALQIELSKAVQRRTREAASLDLALQIRPALDALGDRILGAVVEARDAGELAKSSAADLAVLSPWLDEGERQRLLETLRALGR